MKIDAEKFEKFGITQSKDFPLIMQKYDQIGRTLPVMYFYKNHVKPYAPEVSYQSWKYFIKKFTAEQSKIIEEVMDKSNETVLSIAKMEASSLEKIMKIGHISLEAVMQNPALLASIPISERMTWVFRAMHARDSRARTNLASRADQREQSFYEKIMEGSAYGGIDGDEVPDAEFTELDELDQNQNGDNQKQPILHGLPAGVQGPAAGE